MSAIDMNDELDRIELEASQWMVLVEDGGLDAHHQREFDDWCDADPRHRSAYESVRALWDEMPSFDNLAALSSVEAANDDTARPTRWPRYGMGAFAAAAAVLLAIVVPTDLLRPDTRYQTELAETRIVTLPDGSSVTLGARSAIKVRFSDDERRIVLTGGEAFFDVVHDNSRPFLVEAGNSIIHDIGTKFDVNLTKGAVRVSVLEGLVSVARTDAHKNVKPQLLKAGERAEVVMVVHAAQVAVTSAQTPIVPPIVALPAQAPGAWREGRLVFDNVRLADLADDVNRYYGPGVRVADEVGDLRVTASFKTSEIPMFMRSLSESFPVRASTVDGGSFEVRAAPR